MFVCLLVYRFPFHSINRVCCCCCCVVVVVLLLLFFFFPWVVGRRSGQQAVEQVMGELHCHPVLTRTVELEHVCKYSMFVLLRRRLIPPLRPITPLVWPYLSRLFVGACLFECAGRHCINESTNVTWRVLDRTPVRARYTPLVHNSEAKQLYMYTIRLIAHRPSRANQHVCFRDRISSSFAQTTRVRTLARVLPWRRYFLALLHHITVLFCLFSVWVWSDSGGRGSFVLISIPDRETHDEASS